MDKYRKSVNDRFRYSNIHAGPAASKYLRDSRSSCSCGLGYNNSAGYLYRPHEPLSLEASTIYRDQELLRLKRESLLQSIINVRKSTVDECSKILNSIIKYCECKSNYRPAQPKRRATSCANTERIGSGCSRGGCGGYTPSGWNKLMTIHGLNCDNPCCPCLCDPCKDPGQDLGCFNACPSPCTSDCACTYCMCCPPPCPPAKKKTPKRPRASDYSCNYRKTDECKPATTARPCAKLLGELAFQLERRILDYIFGTEDSKRRRFYGYTVSNIDQMIDRESRNSKGEEDVIKKKDIELRMQELMSNLSNVGYEMNFHPDFAQQIINRYGLLACPPDPKVVEKFGLQKTRCISKLITQLARGEYEASNLQTLLRALKFVSICDEGPLFVW